jgi:predicted phosphodiesterase
MTEPVAVLSDIHGNRWALEAVLADIHRRGIRAVVNLGDCLYGPLDPAGTAGILMELGLPTVRGNEDRIILDEPEMHPDSPSLPFVQKALNGEQRRWLEGLPPTMVAFEDLFLCHGSPADDGEYLLREISPDENRLRGAAAIAATLRTVSQPIVCCGHDHMPAFVRLADGRHVVDPGSVGLPAYRDNSPFPHRMEAGSPHARYAVISPVPCGIDIGQFAIAYDWRPAVAAAVAHGRPDWAGYLASGRVA